MEGDAGGSSHIRYLYVYSGLIFRAVCLLIQIA